MENSRNRSQIKHQYRPKLGLITKKTESVAILLCTFHGETFLSDQLNSFDRQTHTEWKLYVSDDSTDNTSYSILKKFQSRYSEGKVQIRKGPRQGFAKNFLTLACDETIKADYYAYSDQDDLWQSEKLAKAIAWLRTIAPDVPAVYCSRTQLINAHGEKQALSVYFKQEPSFANAIVENIAGGNTMVFNHALKKLLQKAGIVDVPAHDWWTYIVATSCGGKINYQAYPYVFYRLHEDNVLGIKSGFINKLKGIQTLMQGQFKAKIDKHMQALSKLSLDMTASNHIIFKKFMTARKLMLPKRLIGVYRSGIYRQTLFGNIALAVATLINRI